MNDSANKKIFALNLQRLMQIKGIDRRRLCDDLKFKYSTVSEWLSGSKYPRIDKIEALADYFGVSKSVLIEEKSTPVSNISGLLQSYVRMVPVFESVSAGFGAYASNVVIDYTPIYIPSAYEAENTICVRVKGDSMYPKIEDGDIIQVYKQDSVDSGSIAVVLLDGDEGLVKKVVYGKDWIELHSINPMYPVMRFTGEEILRIRVVGLVRKIIKSCD